jgi:hypothetical protein
MNDRDKTHFLSQCDRCSYNTRNPHLPCAVHPGKIVDAQCSDFVPNPSLPAGEWWEPEGASYYGGELVIDPVQRWTREQQLALLDCHPLFTGRCPGCELPMTQTTPARVHWDCQECGWKDDSV